MYVEVIKSITDTEEAARQDKQAALTTAKSKIADAEKKGREAVAAAISNAENQNKKLMQTAELKAVDEAQKLQAETAELQMAIRSKAETRLDKAASLIVERIVNS